MFGVMLDCHVYFYAMMNLAITYFTDIISELCRYHELLHKVLKDLYLEYPVAFPLCIVTLLAFIILKVLQLKASSPKQLTDELRKEIKNKVNDVKEFVGVGTKPRFRKRDKIYFYGKKMLRKVKANIPTKRLPSRQLARKLARRFLGRPDRNVLLEVVEPPLEYMQEELTSIDHNVGLPSEFLFMLRNIRVLGYFDMPLFLELCKTIETVKLLEGQELFRIGESDENIFILQKGHLLVFITESDGSRLKLKEVKPGESIISLLSFCDVLTGYPRQYKTVSAEAAQDSIVMKFPVKAFEDIFKTHPDMFVRVVQTVMAKLMRVTFMALYQYLGLSAELMSQVPRKDHTCIVPVLSSPTKNKREDSICSIGGDFEITDELEPQLSASPERRSGGQKKIVLVDPKSDVDRPSLLKVGVDKFKLLFHLESDEFLKRAVYIREVVGNSMVVRQDSVQDAALVYVLSGSLEVSQHALESSEEVHMFTAQPGDFVGGLTVLSGDPSFYSIKTRQKSILAVITKDMFYLLIQKNPEVVLHVAHTVINRMSPFVRQIDFALDWEHLEAGHALYRQGDMTDSTYIVLGGRLRSVITKANGRKEVVGEYGKGDLVGIVELLMQKERSTTVMAVRDSELAKLPEGLFNIIKQKYPSVMTRLIKLLGERLLGSWKSSGPCEPLGLKIDHQPTQSNFSTVAIVPTSEDVPLSQFTLELYHSLHAIDATMRLTSDYVVKSLGVSIWESANEYQLSSWLGQIEDQHRITLYQCDSSVTVWTQRCIRQADVILIVGLGGGVPQMGKVEKHAEKVAVRTQKILILLHKEDGLPPKDTVQWLNLRSWCQSYHHIRAPKRMFVRRSPTKMLEYYKEKVLVSQPSVHSDFSRLARVLSGTSIGLVLSGGGARGAAHIGMIKALQEVGLPIDMVAGVSIGAIFGALYCLHRDLTVVTQKARELSMKMTSKWRMAMDLTYPIVSMFSGAGFNQIIHDALGNTNIEDLWLPFFTLTTDVNESCARIHTHGCTWRYVRASMSLSGYMPPICDPFDGHLLLDGGYVNNLPADVMKNKWSIGTIIAIDVGSQFDTEFTNYGDFLSGWNLLLRKIFPFSYLFRKELKVPNLYDIQSRLSYVSCTRQLEDLKASKSCEYIRPPIDAFETLQFGSFDIIKEVGYQHGKAYFEEVLKNGKSVNQLYQLQAERDREHPRLHSSPASYTDLAQIVTSAKKTSLVQTIDESSSEDELHRGYLSEPDTKDYFNNEDDLFDMCRNRTQSLSDHELLLHGDPYDYNHTEDADDD